jgi:hypothetical protein
MTYVMIRPGDIQIPRMLAPNKDGTVRDGFSMGKDPYGRLITSLSTVCICAGSRFVNPVALCPALRFFLEADRQLFMLTPRMSTWLVQGNSLLLYALRAFCRQKHPHQ